MKKIVAILLIFIYTFSVPGVTMASHYCMGMIIGKSMGYSENQAPMPDCSLCKKEKHTEKQQKDCCENDNQFIKTISDQDFSNIVFNLNTPIFILSKVDADIHTYGTFTVGYTESHLVIPPDIPLYLEIRNFRI